MSQKRKLESSSLKNAMPFKRVKSLSQQSVSQLSSQNDDLLPIKNSEEKEKNQMDIISYLLSLNIDINVFQLTVNELCHSWDENTWTFFWKYYITDWNLQNKNQFLMILFNCHNGIGLKAAKEINNFCLIYIKQLENPQFRHFEFLNTYLLLQKSSHQAITKFLISIFEWELLCELIKQFHFKLHEMDWHDLLGFDENDDDDPEEQDLGAAGQGCFILYEIAKIDSLPFRTMLKDFHITFLFELDENNIIYLSCIQCEEEQKKFHFYL